MGTKKAKENGATAGQIEKERIEQQRIGRACLLWKAHNAYTFKIRLAIGSILISEPLPNGGSTFLVQVAEATGASKQELEAMRDLARRHRQLIMDNPDAGGWSHEQFCEELVVATAARQVQRMRR